jgi:hypothetical protein
MLPKEGRPSSLAKIGRISGSFRSYRSPDGRRTRVASPKGDLGGLGPLEIELQIVLPGKTDALEGLGRPLSSHFQAAAEKSTPLKIADEQTIRFFTIIGWIK